MLFRNRNIRFLPEKAAWKGDFKRRDEGPAKEEAISKLKKAFRAFCRGLV